MNKSILETAIAELASLGIIPCVWRGGKHYRISWVYKGHSRYHTVPISPSDHRSALNNRSQLRRILRKDGLLAKN